MSNLLRQCLPFFTICAVGSSAIGDTCPPPPNAVNPSVFAKVTLDKKNQLYRYSYEIKNGSNARVPIDFVGLVIGQVTSATKSAPHWVFEYDERDVSPSEF